MTSNDNGSMTLRHCVSAGEPLNPEVIEKWYERTGLTIREGYGQTEMTMSCGMFPCLEVKPGSMGKPAPMYQMCILGELPHTHTDTHTLTHSHTHTSWPLRIYFLMRVPLWTYNYIVLIGRVNKRSTYRHMEETRLCVFISR